MHGTTLTGPTSVPLPVQAQVFEAVASHSILAGPLHDLARQFGVTPVAFMDCLGELVDAGWVTVTTTDDGLFRIQLEP